MIAEIVVDGSVLYLLNESSLETLPNAVLSLPRHSANHVAKDCQG